MGRLNRRRYFDDAFCSLGSFVARRAKCIVLAAFLLPCVAIVGGLLRWRIQNDVRYDYVAGDTTELREYAAYLSFYQGSGKPMMIQVTARHKRSENLVGHVNATSDLLEELEHGLTARWRNATLGYQQLCGRMCGANDAFRYYLSVRHLPQSGLDLVGTALRFPVMSTAEGDYYLGDNMYHVRTDDHGHVTSYKLAVIRLAGMYAMEEISEDPLCAFEWAVFDLVQTRNRDAEYPLHLTMTSECVAVSEITRAGYDNLPYIPLCVLVTAAVALATSVPVGDALRRRRAAARRALLIFYAVVAPGQALMVAYGLLWIVGVPYHPTVAIIPILILAVGVDDAFLMMAAWNRAGGERRPADGWASHRRPVFTTGVGGVKDAAAAGPYFAGGDGGDKQCRLSSALRDVGLSITITSVTNALSFGAGAAAGIPAVRIFCAHAALSFVVDLAYQLLAFSAVTHLLMADSGDSGKGEGKETVECCRKESKRWQSFLECYSRFLADVRGRVVTVLVLVVYAAFLTQIRHIQMRIDNRVVYPPDSPLQEAYTVDQVDVKAGSQRLAVIVARPGDLADEGRLRRAAAMAHDVESCSRCVGASSTQLWLRPFKDFYLPFFNATFDHRLLPSFVEHNRMWRPMLRIDEPRCRAAQGDCVQRYMFTTSYALNGSLDWLDAYHMFDEIRRILVPYADFGATIYEKDMIFTSHYDTIPYTLCLTCGLATVCTCVVCLVCMEQAAMALCAMASVSSVVAGMLAAMAVLDQPVSVSSTFSMVVSVGLGVDATAHMCCALLRRADDDDGDQDETKGGSTDEGAAVRRRLRAALDAVLYPTAQAALTTFLGTTVLVSGTTVAKIFVHTVQLVVAFGFLHAVFILPGVFSVAHGALHAVRRLRQARAPCAT